MKLRFLLPIDKFKLHTKLTAGEVEARLTDNIEQARISRLFSNYQTTKPYQGQITGNRFEITRIIGYRNSFLPIIKGEITTYLGKSELNIIMRPVKAVLIFMCFWLGIVGVICLGLLIAAIVQFKQILQHGFYPGALVPFFMFAFGLALVTFGYRVEAQEAKAFLKTLLEATEYD